MERADLVELLSFLLYLRERPLQVFAHTRLRAKGFCFCAHPFTFTQLVEDTREVSALLRGDLCSGCIRRGGAVANGIDGSVRTIYNKVI